MEIKIKISIETKEDLPNNSDKKLPHFPDYVSRREVDYSPKIWGMTDSQYWLLLTGITVILCILGLLIKHYIVNGTKQF